VEQKQFKAKIMEKLKEIIENNRMSARPEYYSGRGATMSDLDSQILEGIYKGIKKEYGKDAAESYVKMVDGIKVLSATTFLNQLYSLFYNGWKCESMYKDESGISIPKDENGEYDSLIGMISVFGAMSNNRDETQSIKGSFCQSHGIKPKEQYAYDRMGNYRKYW
jgi:hypothetical protein